MTAIVGILNKKAAVMAADSALTVTRGDTTRIYNNSTKIFKLSDKYPVAVMTFNNAEFMDVPLDVLINKYRDKFGDIPYPTLQGYTDNFLDFLSKEKLFCNTELQRQYLRNEIGIYYYKVKQYTIDCINEDLNSKEGKEMTDEERINVKRSRIKEGMQAITDSINEMIGLDKKSPEFKNYSFKQFMKFAKDDIDGLKELCKEDDIPSDMGEDWARGFYDYLCSQFYYNYNGIVVVGYGEDELFPSLIPFYTSGIVDGRLRYFYSETEAEHIGFDNESAICPFAQCDVMMTIMKGMSPAFRGKVSDFAGEAVSQAKDKLIETMKDAGVDAETIQKVQNTNLKDITDKYEDNIQEFAQKEYINGLVETVETFEVDDMVNMAESLIEITNLQRHITSSEESVGGPVDVAVLTRDRGFVWMKHHDWASSGCDVDFRK